MRYKTRRLRHEAFEPRAATCGFMMSLCKAHAFARVPARQNPTIKAGSRSKRCCSQLS